MASDRNNFDIQRLIDDHLDAVYRYAYRLTGVVQDAEDLTQQVFLLAQERLEQLRETERARGWLFTILRNSFLKTVQRTQPVLATSVGLNLEMVPAEGETDRAWIAPSCRRQSMSCRLSFAWWWRCFTLRNVPTGKSPRNSICRWEP